MDWSPFTPEVMADPATGHQHLLSKCPVHHCQVFDPPFYTLSRFDDVENALRDIDTFSSHYGQGPRFTEPQGMLCDPPQHTYVRKIVQQAFMPKAMAELRPIIERTTHELIDQILAGPQAFDLHDDFAFPLPVIIIAGMMGVPQADLDRFKYWSDIQVAAMGAEDPSVYEKDQMDFMNYMAEFLAARRAELAQNKATPNDLLTLVADGRDPDGNLLPDADALSVLNQLLVGGNETTTSLITNMVWRLLEHPDQWRAVVDDPTLAEAAVEESLRFDPPVLGLYRNTTCDVTLHDVTIPANSKVYINYAAANRDASVFTNPDSFDITRKTPRHMSFGLGLHMCLGAPMARLEGDIALRALAERVPQLELVGPGERIAPFFLWGRRRLPVQHA